MDKPSTGSRTDRFTEAARALECDEDEARFNEALGKIARQKLAERTTPACPDESSADR